ncbi:MAG: hypothetical protein COA33_008425 [Fluviicola sp.]|nr:hypothetical protein [Fluviicola sp.]
MKTIIAIALLLLSNILFAQEQYENVTITFAELKLEKSKTVKLISTFKVDEGYIVFKKEPIRGPGGWRYFIETRDTDLKVVSTIDVSQQFEDENYIIERIIRVGNSYALFSTKTFRKEGKTELYLQTFNWESGELSSTKKIHSQTSPRRGQGIHFTTKTSVNDKLLMYEVYKTGKDKLARKHYTVLDEALEVLWTNDNVFYKADDGKDYYEQSVVLGNNGEIYALGYKILTRNRKAGIKQGEKEFEIARITEDDIETIKIDVKGHKLDDVQLTQTKDGALFFGGYYLNKDVYGIEGVFLLTLDKESLEVEDEFWSEFTHDFITEGWSERKTKKAKKIDDKGKLALTNLYLRNVLKHDDGSISLVGERYWVTITTTTTANGGTTTRTTYHYGDLVITRISNSGELLSQSKYQKHKTHFGAHDVVGVGNNLFVLILEKKIKLIDKDVKTMEKKERKKYDGWAFAATKINSEGKQSPYMLIDYTAAEYVKFRRYDKVYRNSSIVRNDDKVELLVVTYKGSKKWALGRFSFTKED